MHTLLDKAQNNTTNIKEGIVNINKLRVMSSILLSICLLMTTIAMFCYSITLIFYLILLPLTLSLFYFLNKNKIERSATSFIFLITFFLGLILSIVINIDFIEHGKTFKYPDQVAFFEQAKFLASKKSTAELIRSATYDYPEYNIFYALIGLIAFLDYNITGSVNLIPLSLSVVYITALIPVFLYHTIKLYIPSQLALKSSIFYGTLTPIIAYSGYLLRDMHLALLMSIILFWVVREISIGRVIGILLITSIISNLRFANAFLSLAYLSIYILLSRTSHKYTKPLYFGIALSLLIYYNSEILNTYSLTLDRLDRYENFTNEQVEQSDGIGKKLHNLPPILKESSIVIIGITSFPFWGKINQQITPTQAIMIMYSTISNIGWFFIVVGSVYFSKNIYKSLKRSNHKILLYLLITSLLYIISNINNMNLRRIVYVFPVIYITFVITYQHLPSFEKRKHIILTFFIALMLSLGYTVLKI